MFIKSVKPYLFLVFLIMNFSMIILILKKKTIISKLIKKLNIKIKIKIMKMNQLKFHQTKNLLIRANQKQSIKMK